VSGIVMPSGDPDLLERLAAQLKAAAVGAEGLGSSTGQVTASIRSGAEWTGDAADSYTAFTGNLSQGASAAEAPMSRIAAAVRDYAGYLRTAQQKVAEYASAAEVAQVSGNDAGYVAAAEAVGQEAEAAVAAWQEAGDHAATEVGAATGQLREVFGFRGPVQAWLDRQPAPWDSLASAPGPGDPSGSGILKTPGADFGPEILKTPGEELGPEILITPQGGLGALILEDPIFQPGNEILRTPPGEQRPLINYSDEPSETEVEPEGDPPDGITGYTQHGLQQALGRDNGAGVSESAINDAVQNPIQVGKGPNDTYRFVGKNATVVLNPEGKVVTAWANNSSGRRNAP
jgi:uncharacterized protein YukE